MTLILSNEELDRVLKMPECIEALERAYHEHATRRAVNRHRSDVYAAHERPDAFYVFKSFEGMLPSEGVVALRLNSDVIEWSEYAGTTRKDKVPAADGRWVGLVLLFSTVTGEPLAIFPDGVVQRMRVGATNAIAAQYLARDDARVLGLLGAGWQAGAQVMGMAAIRQLDEVRVFSPNPQSRERFADEYSERLGLPIRAVGSAQEAVEGAGFVNAATNAIGAVLQPDWIQPGMHVTCVKRSELGEALLARCDRVVLHSHEGAPHNYLVGLGDSVVPLQDPIDLARRLRAGEQVSPDEIERLTAAAPASRGEPILTDLLSGEVPGRQDEREITAFVNNIGLGLQFAAIGALGYRRAKARGLGRELPTEWFTEDVHP